MDAAIQQAVRERAKHRCEYCHFPASFAELPLHHDHVIAQQHGGETALENLAVAFCHCNRYKGPTCRVLTRLVPSRATLPSASGQMGKPFLMGWAGADWQNINRTRPIRALRLNRSDAVSVRQLWMEEGVFPAEK